MPKIDNDRGEDNWQPVLTIADLIGEHWPNLARYSMGLIENVSLMIKCSGVPSRPYYDKDYRSNAIKGWSWSLNCEHQFQSLAKTNSIIFSYH